MTTLAPLEPLDATHADAIALRDRIRHDFAQARRAVARWDLTDCPDGWADTERRRPLPGSLFTTTVPGGQVPCPACHGRGCGFCAGHGTFDQGAA